MSEVGGVFQGGVDALVALIVAMLLVFWYLRDMMQKRFAGDFDRKEIPWL